MEAIRNDFPILRQRVNGNPLIWFDNGATTQKPLSVINTLSQYYREYNSNVHRGAHTMAVLATKAYEEARNKVQLFLGASSTEEIIFVRGATEAINLVSQAYGGANIQEGDEILLTEMEHHSNIVPWQVLAKQKGARIKVIPMNDKGEIILEEYRRLLTLRTKLVGITHVSNVLGTINPVEEMTRMAHDYGACVLIDGAQAAPHFKVNVKQIDADFYVFSGHKAYAPTGIGVLYGKKAILEAMPPWQTGGGMIKDVSFEKTDYNSLPDKFEAGTGNIADAIGLGAAIDYMNKLGLDQIEQRERTLTQYAMERISCLPDTFVFGNAVDKTSVISFIMKGISPVSIAKYLDQKGIAIRAGHHCAQPALRHFGVDSTARVSLGLYNTKNEIDILVYNLISIHKNGV